MPRPLGVLRYNGCSGPDKPNLLTREDFYAYSPSFTLNEPLYVGLCWLPPIQSRDVEALARTEVFYHPCLLLLKSSQLAAEQPSFRPSGVLESRSCKTLDLVYVVWFLLTGDHHQRQKAQTEGWRIVLIVLKNMPKMNSPSEKACVILRVRLRLCAATFKFQ